MSFAAAKEIAERAVRHDNAGEKREAATAYIDATEIVSRHSALAPCAHARTHTHTRTTHTHKRLTRYCTAVAIAASLRAAERDRRAPKGRVQPRVQRMDEPR